VKFPSLRTEILLFLLILVCLGFMLTLTLTAHPVPEALWGITIAAVAGWLGVSPPTGSPPTS
jgi:hypothetical protein